jgi:uncharacterized protein (DUF1330 family)
MHPNDLLCRAPQENAMSAYFIVYTESVTDLEELKEYRRIALPVLQKSKAIIRVRNGKFESLEGAAPQGVVMLEFPTMEDARSWYHSPEYKEALKHRFLGANCRVVLVEGV